MSKNAVREVSSGAEHSLASNSRKPYARPAILSRESLEATAGACTGGKTDSTACPTGPVSS